MGTAKATRDDVNDNFSEWNITNTLRQENDEIKKCVIMQVFISVYNRQNQQNAYFCLNRLLKGDILQKDGYLLEAVH